MKFLKSIVTILLAVITCSLYGRTVNDSSKIYNDENTSIKKTHKLFKPAAIAVGYTAASLLTYRYADSAGICNVKSK